MEKVIVDSCWSGDEAQLMAVLLQAKDKIEILGVNACFGNASHEHSLANAGNILHFLKAEGVKYHPGSTEPTNGSLLEGDDAHGSNGIGGVHLMPTPAFPQRKDAITWMLEVLSQEPPQTVSIIAVAPLSNIAAAIQRDPVTMKRVKRILIMGGCTEQMPAADRPFRSGNITPDAEFNFFMAAEDAHAVMQSELPIILFPMNCTHQMTLTPDREDYIRRELTDFSQKAEELIGMMRAPIELDKLKFNSSPVMHDVHTALYLVDPESYSGRKGRVLVLTNGDKMGQSVFILDRNGTVMVMEKILDPETGFRRVVSAIKARFEA